MNCYVCHQGVHPGGTHYGTASASGICQHCGIAVCRAHSRKAPAAGAPLLCSDCATLGAQPASRVVDVVRPAPRLTPVALRTEP